MTTRKKSAGDRPDTSKRASFSIGTEAERALEDLWHDHVKMDGSRCRGKSDCLRDLIFRALQAQQKKRR